MEKLTELDFFDASRIVAGTNRGIRIGSEGSWSCIIWHDTLEKTCLILRDKSTGKEWFPCVVIQKEKNWEVEPEERKTSNHPSAIIPWREIDKDNMPKKEFECLAIMQSGAIRTGRWMKFGDFWSMAADERGNGRVAYYCPLEEIPRPE